jgi:hypothetical protein
MSDIENPWTKYSEHTKANPARKLLVKAVKYVQHRERALDLGPGALNDSKYLLDQGFQMVVAVNKDPLGTDPVAQSRAAGFPKEHFQYRESTFDAFDFSINTYDLINAQYSLPFNPPQTFDNMFESIIASLKHGGIVTGQFFGPDDEWSTNADMTFVTRARAQQLLRDCGMIYFDEAKEYRLAMRGQKYCHIFEFIGRKKSGGS